MNTPIISIKMVPAGVETVVAALRELPHKQVDGLIKEIWGQYQFQMQELQKAAAQPAEPAPEVEHVEEATGLTD